MELALVGDRERGDERLDAREAERVAADEGGEVDLGGEPHDELAVDAVEDAAVPRDERGEVVHLVRALDPRGEEAAKRRDDRREEPEDEGVQLDGEQRDLGDARPAQRGRVERAPLEDGGRVAAQRERLAEREVVGGADERVEAREEEREGERPDQREEAAADEGGSDDGNSKPEREPEA